MKRTILALAVACFFAASARAANQTPGSSEAAVFLPYNQDTSLSALDDAALQALPMSGYTMNVYEQSSATRTPSVKVNTLRDILAATNGVFYGVSHGDSTSNGAMFAAEVYEHSDEGLEAMFDAYNTYTTSGGYTTSHLDVGEDINGRGYALYVTGSFLSYVSRSGMNRVSILIACQCASLLPSFGGRWGAAIKSSQCSGSDLETLFLRLSGGGGPDLRPGSAAVNGLTTLVGWGSGATVLFPMVTAQSHSDDTNISAETPMWMEFDCDMNTSQSPLDRSGMIYILNRDRRWVGANRYEFSVVPLGVGVGTVVAAVEIAVSAPGGIPVNAGRFDHRITLYGTRADNGAASVSGFRVTDGVAHFLAESEWSTASYRIDGRLAENDPFVPLVTLTAVGAGSYSTAVPSATHYRLVEIEVSGRTILQDETAAGPAPAPPEVLAFDLAGLRQSIAEKLAVLQARPTDQTSGIRRCLYVAPAAWESDVQSLMELGETEGVQGVFIPTETFTPDPNSFRLELRMLIADYAQLGFRYVQLIGSSNDYQQMFDSWDSWWPAGEWQTVRTGYINQGFARQEDRDLIPTFYVADSRPRPEGMTWFRPYYDTDVPYGDGVPDVVVARAPLAIQAELVAWIHNEVVWRVSGRPPKSIGVWANDRDASGNSGPFVADLVESQVLPAIPADYTTEVLWTSAIGGYHPQREQAIRTQVSSGVEAVVTISTLSTRYRTADFHSETFAVESIPSSTRFVMIGATCEVGGFNRTHHPSYGSPVGTRFLTSQGRGAIAWIAPSAGTWQDGDALFAVASLQAIYGARQRPLAESFFQAQVTVLTARPDLHDLVQSFGFSGCVFTRLNTNDIVTDLAGSISSRRTTIACVPNPFNATANLTFTVAKPGRTTLDLYDVRGRKLRTLFAGRVQPGQRYTVAAVGISEQMPLASGCYVLRLSNESDVLSQKVTILR